jgi:hypothetical protein
MRGSKGPSEPCAASTLSGAGDEGRSEGALALVEAGERQRGRDLRAVQEREPSFGASGSGSSPARESAAAAGRPLAPSADVADAEEQGGGQVRQGREVAGGADGALGRDDGEEVEPEGVVKALDRRPAHAGGALPRPAILSASARRTTGAGSGSPTPDAWDRTRLRWRRARSVSAMRTEARRPKPVLMP